MNLLIKITTSILTLLSISNTTQASNWQISSHENKNSYTIKDVNICLENAKTIENSAHYDSLEYLANKAYEMAKVLDLSKEKMEASYLLGKSKYMKSETLKAIKLLNISLALARGLNKDDYIAKAQYFKALSYQKGANYSLAFTWFYKAHDFCINKIKEGKATELVKYYAKLISRNLSYNFVYSSKNKEGVNWYLNKISQLPNQLPVDIQRMYYSDISYIYSQGLDHKNGVKYIKLAYNISSKTNYEEDKYQDLAYLGIAYGRTDIEKSTKYNLLSLNHVPIDDEKRAWVYNDLSWNYGKMGQLEKAVEYQFKSINIHEIRKDSIGLMFGFISLGIKLNYWRFYDEAEAYLKEAAKFFRLKKLHLKLSEVTNHLCNLYLKTKQFKKAKKCIKTLNINKNLLNIPRATGLYLLNLADYEMRVDRNYNSAEKKLKSAIKVFEKVGDKQNLTYGYSLLGSCQFTIKNYKKAKENLIKSLELIEQYTQIYIKEDCLKLLVKIYEKENNNDHAFKAMKELSSLQSIIFDRETKIKLLKSEAGYKMGFTGNLNKEEKSTKPQKNSFSSIILISLALLCLVIFLIYIIVIYRHMIVKKEKRLIQDRLKEKQLEAEKYSKILIDRENKIQELKKINKFTQPKVSNESNHMNKIGNIIKKGYIDNQSWVELYENFNQVYPKFVSSLNEDFPILTEHDIKILTLIRLFVHTQDIANCLGISKSSVMTARYRLRKKLKLEKEQKFNDIFKNIS